jgi:chromosome segregation ATPase
MKDKRKGKPGGKKELAEAKARLEAELARLEEEFAAEKESLEAALAAKEAERETARAEAEAEKRRLDNHVEQLRAALDDSHSEAAQLRERLEAVLATCATLELRIEDGEKEREETTAEHARERGLWQVEREHLARDIERLERELSAWNGTLYARLRRVLSAPFSGSLARRGG